MDLTWTIFKLCRMSIRDTLVVFSIGLLSHDLVLPVCINSCCKSVEIRPSLGRIFDKRQFNPLAYVLHF